MVYNYNMPDNEPPVDMTRRSFLKNAGLAGAVVAADTLLSRPSPITHAEGRTIMEDELVDYPEATLHVDRRAEFQGTLLSDFQCSTPNSDGSMYIASAFGSMVGLSRLDSNGQKDPSGVSKLSPEQTNRALPLKPFIGGPNKRLLVPIKDVTIISEIPGGWDYKYGIRVIVTDPDNPDINTGAMHSLDGVTDISGSGQVALIRDPDTSFLIHNTGSTKVRSISDAGEFVPGEGAELFPDGIDNNIDSNHRVFNFIDPGNPQTTGFFIVTKFGIITALDGNTRPVPVSFDTIVGNQHQPPDSSTEIQEEAASPKANKEPPLELYGGMQPLFKDIFDYDPSSGTFLLVDETENPDVAADLKRPKQTRLTIGKLAVWNAVDWNNNKHRDLFPRGVFSIAVPACESYRLFKQDDGQFIVIGAMTVYDYKMQMYKHVYFTSSPFAEPQVIDPQNGLPPEKVRQATPTMYRLNGAPDDPVFNKSLLSFGPNGFVFGEEPQENPNNNSVQVYKITGIDYSDRDERKKVYLPNASR